MGEWRHCGGFGCMGFESRSAARCFASLSMTVIVEARNSNVETRDNFECVNGRNKKRPAPGWADLANRVAIGDEGQMLRFAQHDSDMEVRNSNVRMTERIDSAPGFDSFGQTGLRQAAMAGCFASLRMRIAMTWG